MRSLTETDVSPTDLVVISPTIDLLNTVIGVFHPIDDSTPTENQAGSTSSLLSNELPNDLIKTNIAGYIVVVQINIEGNLMTILSPCPGVLPSKYLLVGSIKWIEK